MWNYLSLQCPSEDMCKYGQRDADLILEMSGLATLLTSSAESLTQESPVWEEVKVFRNIQSKYKQILHCDKCLLYLQRVGGCLRKMVILNLSKSFLDLGELIIKGLQKKSHETLFPSKQQIEYVLVRCQAAAKLVLESLHYSRKAFYYLVDKLNVGHLVLHLIMAISVTARVNILFRSILANLFSIYRKLYPWVHKLKKGSHDWPQNLNLPDDLEMWLKPDEDELLSPNRIPKERLDFLNKLFSKKNEDASSDNDADSVVEMKSEEESIIECVKSDSSSESDSEAEEPDLEIVADEPDLEIITDEPDMNSIFDVGKVITRKEEREETEDKTHPVLKLTQKQEMLVKKIASAQNLKRIKIIWNHLNVSNPDLLPKALTPGEIRIIERMLARSKREIVELKSTPLTKAIKQKKKRVIIKLAAKKLIRHLGLSKPSVSPNSADATASLEPVRTFPKLKVLYRTLYDKMQSQQRYDKCEELEKVFKSRKEDIKILKERNEKDVIKNLIFCTSKVLLALYEK